MAANNALERMQRELDRAVATLRADVDRVELLTVALAAFNGPIPDYEPSFQYAPRLALETHELGGEGD